MASTWDTLAFDRNGPGSGIATNHERVRLEIRKNLLRIHEWPEGQPDRAVADVYHGQLTYRDWTIHVRQGPQDGVYVVAWSSGLGDAGIYTNKTLLVGCCVRSDHNPKHTYRDRIAQLGIDPDTVFESSGPNATVLMGVDDNKQLVTIVDDISNDKADQLDPAVLDTLTAMTADIINDSTYGAIIEWPGEDLAAIPWDKFHDILRGPDPEPYNDEILVLQTPPPVEPHQSALTVGLTS